MPLTVDLLTEIRHAAENPQKVRCLAAISCNRLFYWCNFLVKYCTPMKIALPDGHLAVSPEAYSQSYPQKLCVRIFFFQGNGLRQYAKVFSNITLQALEPV